MRIRTNHMRSPLSAAGTALAAFAAALVLFAAAFVFAPAEAEAAPIAGFSDYNRDINDQLYYRTYGRGLHDIQGKNLSYPWHYTVYDVTVCVKDGVDAEEIIVPPMKDWEDKVWLDENFSAEEDGTIGVLTFEEGITGISRDFIETGVYVGTKCTDGMTKVVIPSSLRMIGANAFRQCNSLRTVAVGSGEYAFEEEGTIYLPPSITTLADAFMDTYPDTVHISVTPSDYYQRIGGFKESSVKKLIIDGSTIKTIDNEAFNNCTQLTDVTIASPVEVIQNDAFSCCDSLEKIVLPDTVTSVESQTRYYYNYKEGAFSYCHNLKEITFSTNMEYFSRYSFQGSENLKTIRINGVEEDLLPDVATSLNNLYLQEDEQLMPARIFSGVPVPAIKKDQYWETPLTCAGVTYPDRPHPEAEASTGNTVTYLFADEADGPWINAVPSDPGSYYVKAVAAESNRFNELESAAIPVTIHKGNPTIVCTNDGKTVCVGDTKTLFFYLKDVAMTESIWIDADYLIKNGKNAIMTNIGDQKHSTKFTKCGWFKMKIGVFEDKYINSAEKTVKIKVIPKKPVPKVAKRGKFTCQLQWPAVKGIKRYEVKYSLNKNLSGAKTKSYTFRNPTLYGLKKGRTYYYKVRAVGKGWSDKKEYSSGWTAVKSFTTKK